MSEKENGMFLPFPAEQRSQSAQIETNELITFPLNYMYTCCIQNLSNSLLRPLLLWKESEFKRIADLWGFSQRKLGWANRPGCCYSVC